MSSSPQSKHTSQIFGTLKLYDNMSKTWSYIRPQMIGDMKYSIHTFDHAGWLMCDGRSLSKSQFADLYQLVGDTYGNPTPDTFNLPDLRGRVMGNVGQGTGLTNRSTGTMIGSETHTLSVNEMPSHNHTGTTNTAGSHTHTSNAIGGQGNLGLSLANGASTAIETDVSLGELNLNTTPFALTISSNGDHVHNFTTGSVGGGAPHNNMQPTAFIGNYFIYGKN